MFINYNIANVGPVEKNVDKLTLNFLSSLLLPRILDVHKGYSVTPNTSWVIDTVTMH